MAEALGIVGHEGATLNIAVEEYRNDSVPRFAVRIAGDPPLGRVQMVGLQTTGKDRNFRDDQRIAAQFAGAVETIGLGQQAAPAAFELGRRVGLN
jgi:hypothetical protein